MTTFVALCRGINVGGTRKLPMAELQAACLALGWDNPQTYIQSGNLIVDAPLAAGDMQSALAQQLNARLGWSPDIIVRTREAWHLHVAANPFASPSVDPRVLHVYLTQAPLNEGAAAQLQARATAGERAVIAGGALWIDYGASGIAGSKMTPAVIDRACGSPATGRNFNTVQRLSAMLEARHTSA